MAAQRPRPATRVRVTPPTFTRSPTPLRVLAERCCYGNSNHGDMSTVHPALLHTTHLCAAFKTFCAIHRKYSVPSCDWSSCGRRSKADWQVDFSFSLSICRPSVSLPQKVRRWRRWRDSTTWAARAASSPSRRGRRCSSTSGRHMTGGRGVTTATTAWCRISTSW